jgi:hypothetical protein
MVSTSRQALRWVFVGGILLAGYAATRGLAFAWPMLVGAVLAAFWAWWPDQSRQTDDRHCSVCGYPFPDRDRALERRCPECGSVD